MLFAGEFEGHVDSRGRIAVPPAFTQALSGVIVVARGFERCISIYSEDGWKRLADEIEELPATDAESRRLARFIFASADEQQPDGQGRIELPAALRRYAGIDRDVVVIGTGHSVEVWDSESWAAEIAGLHGRLSKPGGPAVNEQAAA